MARKSSSGGGILLGLILLGLIAQSWQVILPVTVVGLLIWFAVNKSQASPKSQRQVSNSSLGPTHSGDDEITFTITTSYENRSCDKPPKESVSPDSVWMPYGKKIEHSGYTILGGFLYFGKNLQSIQRWESEPSLIDPSLPVDRSNPDREGLHMGYWPSYSQIHPTSRAAYLEWLSTGRKHPNINIGYVFLYFYGLERRALADAKDSSSAQQELPRIQAEIRRLLSIYGTHNSFRGYASRFLDALQLSQTPRAVYETTPQFDQSSYDVPLLLKIALGQLAEARKPLPVDWALAWALNDPSISKRTPVTRCPEEFSELFRIRYAEKFGEGIDLKPNKTKIQASYHPASSSFGGSVQIPVPDLPDLTAITGPTNKISDIVSTCTDEIDAYSRFLGRNPDGKNSIEASSYLPKALLKKHAGKELRNLANWLTTVFSSQLSKSVPLTSLLTHIPSVSKDKFGKKDATSIANILAKLGVGMEPDPRFGSLVPKIDQEVVLYRMSKNAPNSPSTEYSAATVVLHLASAVAAADGSIDEAEEKHLEQQLEKWLHLSSDEKNRLRAHTQWLLTTKPGMNGMKKRIESLKLNQKESLGRFLIAVAQADGYIAPTEMKILTKIYGLLGFDLQSLYSHAHTASVEPITVQSAELVKPEGYKIPSAPQKITGLSLDMRTIEAKLAETAAVSSILNEIFVDEEQAAEAASIQEEVADKSPIPGLDAETSHFMRTLASKLSWAREELERLAAEQDLMLDGVLDSINDAAFDYFGGPFFEGDDPIEINDEFAKEVMT
ncbi:MAG: TerB N-terminal domain-containing protein [Candidatus Vecturithrix sp.]|jgi:tellurite resistance protein|nr:TerB N-terminal domain-containing protein [Candidatus Vecturithrix sp.]